MNKSVAKTTATPAGPTGPTVSTVSTVPTLPTGPTVLKKKVSKPSDPSTVVPVTTTVNTSANTSANTGTEPVLAEKKHTSSKTTTGNMDKIISTLIELSQKIGKLDDASVRKALKELLPSTSEYRLKKHKRPEGQPKKALSSYMFFTINNRKAVETEDPKLEFQGITKELGSRWKKLDAAAKKKYEDMATQDKVRYAKEMEEYQKLHPVAPVEPKVKKLSTKGSKVVEVIGDTTDKIKKPRAKKEKVSEVPIAVAATA